jgi:hypothetical protein
MFQISNVHNFLTVNKGNIIRDPIRVKNFLSRINNIRQLTEICRASSILIAALPPSFNELSVLLLI